MKELSIRTLEADYFKEFSCVGSQCRHNCCNQQWNIFIDKKTYQKYQNLRGHKELSALIKQQVRRTENPENDQSYAYIKQLKDPVRCGLQTKEGLCLVQRELGEDYLSRVCKIYPRANNGFQQVSSNLPCFERACQFSCEEVVHLLLEKKGHILFEITTETKSPSAFVRSSYNCQYLLEEAGRPILTYYYDIKSFGIAILQNDEYSPEDRLVLLALFLEKLDQVEKSTENEKVPELLAAFMAAVDEHAYDEFLSSVEGSDYASDTGYFLIRQSILMDASSLASPIIAQINENLLKEGSWQEYASNYKKFMEDKWMFTEHLLVNVFFQEMMPFYKKFSVAENSQYLVAIYGTLKFLITAYLGPRPDMTDVELIDLIAFFGRLIMHSSVRIGNLVTFMKDNDMSSPAHLAVLIKG